MSDNVARDVLAQARALLASMEALPRTTYIAPTQQIAGIVRALADECDALRAELAKWKDRNDGLVDATFRATQDGDEWMDRAIKAERECDALRRRIAALRETGAEGAETTRGIPE